MNITIINKIIEEIENNYHEVITPEKIKQITNKSHGYVRDEFKKIVEMSLDKYRIRRELSLIIKEISINRCKIEDGDLRPWEQSGFNKAFKKEFGCTPGKMLREKEWYKLQDKFDVKKYEQEYHEHKKIMEKLIRKYGGVTQALKFLLSLSAYELDPIGNLFIITRTDLKEILIKKRYSYEIGEKFYCGPVPDKFKNKHEKLLELYDLENPIEIKQYIDNESGYKLPLPLRQYYIVKRGLIESLLNRMKDKNLLNVEISPRELITLWNEQVNLEEIDTGEVLMPKELVYSCINTMKKEILRYLLFQEQGRIIFNTFEELRNEIGYDYNKFKCKNCNYGNECIKSDFECHIESDFEELTIERLKEEINQLLIEGLVYVKK